MGARLMTKASNRRASHIRTPLPLRLSSPHLPILAHIHSHVRLAILVHDIVGHQLHVTLDILLIEAARVPGPQRCCGREQHDPKLSTDTHTDVLVHVARYLLPEEEAAMD